MLKSRVLAVEDSPTQGELLVGHLENAGFDVTLATNGAAAVDCLVAQSFDIVLSDVVMPGMDGYELCRRVKAHDRDLPVVLLTSLTDPLEIVRGLEAGADNFLRKPYDPAQLINRLQTMLYHRAMRAGGRASMGLEVVLRDKRFLITAERQQILDLLISSFEDLVASNRDLAARDQALEAAAAELRTQLEATEGERRRLATVLDAVPNPMVIIDAAGTVTDASEQLCVLLGQSHGEVVGQDVGDLASFVDATGQPVTARILAVAIDEGRTVELGSSFDLFIERADGRRTPVIAKAAPVRDADGAVIAAVGALHEIDELAAHDAVTALPNQTLFVDRVGRALHVGPGGAAVIAVVIDRFANVHGLLGDRGTDRLLAAVSATIREFLGSEATRRATSPTHASAAHFGNGVFAVIWPDLDDEFDAVRLAQGLHGRLGEAHLSTEGDRFDISFTVGLTVGTSEAAPTDATATAMAAARRGSAAGGARVQIADPDIDARAAVVRQRADELRRAIEQRELVVHYQPAIDLHSGAILGAEALVRWEHPIEGRLLPGDFLPAAESAGLLGDLGWFVLDEACTQAAAWQTQLDGGSRLTMSVNLDATQLVDPRLVERVSASLSDAGLDPTGLILEITERGVVDQPGWAAENLREIKALGVRLAIDDFGTGYSSLQQLRRFPVDTLKIDREFVDGMTSEADDAAIVAATVRLGRALGLETVAEGVETEEQLVQLRVLGCDAAQGFHWTPALPPSEFEAWWEQHGSRDMPVESDTTETLDDASARLDEIVAYLVHELRTPLTVVMGFADLAVRHGAAEPQYLEPILRNIEDLDRRLGMLADLRRAAHGALPLTLDTLDVADVVRTVVNDLLPQLEPHHVAIHADTAAIARIDRFRFAQAITNLLQNAAKFSPPEASIDVVVRGADGLVEVAVRDHGPGIVAHRRPELFRRFSRLGSKHTGMGVGLYLVRAIARAHGGDVRYDDAPGGGALFTVTVPGEAEHTTSSTKSGSSLSGSDTHDLELS